MSIIREIARAIRITILLWLVTAIIYPLIILGVGQTAFKFHANGSIMQNIQGEAIGSALIGQQFRSDRYFQGRPSTVRYSQGKIGKPYGISGASNLAPSSPDLLNRIVERANEFTDENIQPFADLIYTSGSGLDPHITVRTAQEQLSLVARARGINREEILPLLRQYTDGKFLGVFGEPGVNILKLNYALDLQEINRRENQ
ncbi:K(+)-transporting ATPase subunit C [Chlorogloeopsis sp. ULAP01]|uniref:K(+)-transporting ATPase subunit C n=1 Tax=Chlorogloeopsis sp. ULAP01 TaxID=3056483 RepID=UPI0025AA92C8|nr:K(+)-transporting ATPase subunit C [Chlorogloeopsis sp. ULAP01]MDM9384216.1 K(+)-transporting ATPase subunit C [Chlorogloeopsis sp. ULAP01]